VPQIAVSVSKGVVPGRPSSQDYESGGNPISTAPSQIPQTCWYPQSHTTARSIRDELAAVARNKGRCSSIYLDTVESMSDNSLCTEGENHHQGLARSHKLSDGSVHFVLACSEVGKGQHGSLSIYRFDGPTIGGHVLTTNPLTVAPMRQILTLNERHPSDLVFLPEVNHLDAGYVFLTEGCDRRAVTCYRWDPHAGMVPRHHRRASRAAGPTLCSWTGWTISPTWESPAATGAGAHLLAARDSNLFPKCSHGSLDPAAFHTQGRFTFPVHSPAQAKLIRDGEGAWAFPFSCQSHMLLPGPFLA
jgi:hypothetical protein